MLKQLSFKHSKENKFFVVGCTHFNHDRNFIYEPRGYSSFTEMDSGIKQDWNRRISNNDTVMHLGDFCFRGNGTSTLATSLLQTLNFKEMYMVWGNHNSSIEQFYWENVKAQTGQSFQEVYPLTVDLGGKFVVFVGDMLEASVNRQKIVFCHFPFRTWHKNGKGFWNICSHSHGNDVGINPDCTERKVLDVGIENGSPFDFDQVKYIMDRKMIETTDHHDRKTT